MLQRPGEADLLRDVVRLAADAGSLRLLLLAGPEGVVATQIDLVCGDTHFHWKTAYDERWQRMSPGRLLLTHVLEQFAASDLRRWTAARWKGTRCSTRCSRRGGSSPLGPGPGGRVPSRS